MTLPTLMSEYNKTTYVTGLKKAYSVLQNAVKMLPTEMGCPAGDYSCVGLHRYQDKENLALIAKVMKAEPYIEKTTEPWKSYCSSENAGCFMTDDGMIFFAASNILDGGSSIGVDVNGVKGPNKVGRDIFTFEMLVPGYDYYDSYCSHLMGTVFPTGKAVDIDGNYTCTINDATTYSISQCTTGNANSNDSYYSRYCTAKVLNEGKMDY